MVAIWHFNERAGRLRDMGVTSLRCAPGTACPDQITTMMVSARTLMLSYPTLWAAGVGAA